MSNEKNKMSGRKPEDNKQASAETTQEKTTVLQEIISWIEVIAVALVLAWLITSFIIINATVPSGSMENTIMPGNRLFGLRLTYYFSEPKRGDIAVFKYPVNEALISKITDKPGKAFLKANDIKHVNYIKRVIGLPGETVEIRDAKIYINGSDEPLEENYLKEEWVKMNDNISFTVPEGYYLMLGDNRNNSSDGRYWKKIAEKYFTAAGFNLTDEELSILSFVPRKMMLGKAYFRYWPLTKMGVIH